MGRDFEINCNDDERDSLLLAVEYLNKKIRDINAKSTVKGNDRNAVMAALNIAHEFLSSPSQKNFDMDEFRRRIISMQATLDQAMSPQEKLF